MGEDLTVEASLEGEVRVLEVGAADATELVATGKLFEASEAAA